MHDGQPMSAIGVDGAGRLLYSMLGCCHALVGRLRRSLFHITGKYYTYGGRYMKYEVFRASSTI